jgi:tetratricopeptide (TPR) repeat protein
MRFTRGLPVALAAAALAAQAEPSPELLDLAGRVHYGYYHAEPRTIEAAITALDRLGDSPEVFYYRDFAALRRAQLGDTDRSTSARLGACAQRSVPPGLDKRFAAEAWVLVAACAHAAGDDGRRERALSLARERDDDNPRIALVEAWALERAAGADAARLEAVAAQLAAAVEAFEAWTPSIDDPDWGHAEALTAMAAAALERGQARTARDLVERALLLVPDYRAALDVRVALQAARGAL